MHGSAFNFVKNAKYNGYQRGLASVVNKLFDKKTSGGVIKNNIKQRNSWRFT